MQKEEPLWYNEISQISPKEALLLNNIQYIADTCTDFMNYSFKNLIFQETSLADIAKEPKTLLNTMETTRITERMEQTDETIYELVKPSHPYQVKEKSRNGITVQATKETGFIKIRSLLPAAAQSYTCPS